MRKPASNPRTIVRLSVPVDVPTHAKLRAISALRGVDASVLAAGFVRQGVRGVVLRDVDQVEAETPSLP